MALRGNVGSIAGLLLGTSAMAWLLVRAFDSRNELLKVITALFVLKALGYFAGGWVEGYVAGMRLDRLLCFAVTKQERMRTAMLLWGVCYGLGLGAGLGLGLYWCQAKVRALLGQTGQAHLPVLDFTLTHFLPEILVFHFTERGLHLIRSLRKRNTLGSEKTGVAVEAGAALWLETVTTNSSRSSWERSGSPSGALRTLKPNLGNRSLASSGAKESR
jgi:hypothetical protein